MRHQLYTVEQLINEPDKGGVLYALIEKLAVQDEARRGYSKNQEVILTEGPIQIAEKVILKKNTLNNTTQSISVYTIDNLQKRRLKIQYLIKTSSNRPKKILKITPYPLVVIDFTAAEYNDMLSVVRELFSQIKEPVVIARGESCFLPNLKKCLIFNQDIIARYNKKGELVFDVVKNKVIGHGGMANIKPITRTIKLSEENTGGLIFKKRPKADANRLAAKISKNKKDIALMEREAKVTPSISYLKFKTGIKGDNGLYYMVFHRFENAMELGDYIDNELIKLTGLDKLKQLISITLQLFEQLIELHKSIVYRDAKPENILYIGGKTYYIDFGFSDLLVDEDRLINAGTPCYAAPEVFSAQTAVTRKADIFSLSHVLAVLWGADPFYADNARGEKISLSAILEKTIAFLDTNKKYIAKEYSADFKQVFLTMLSDMSKIDPSQRCELEAARDLFKRAVAKYYPDQAKEYCPEGFELLDRTPLVPMPIPQQEKDSSVFSCLFGMFKPLVTAATSCCPPNEQSNPKFKRL